MLQPTLRRGHAVDGARDTARWVQLLQQGGQTIGRRGLILDDQGTQHSQEAASGMRTRNSPSITPAVSSPGVSSDTRSRRLARPVPVPVLTWAFGRSGLATVSALGSRRTSIVSGSAAACRLCLMAFSIKSWSDAGGI